MSLNSSPEPWKPPPRRPITSRPMTPLEKRRYEDALWAAHDAEVQQHYGKLVVVRNKRIIAVGVDERALLEQACAQEQCSPDEFVVELVPPLEPIEYR